MIRKLGSVRRGSALSRLHALIRSVLTSCSGDGPWPASLGLAELPRAGKQDRPQISGEAGTVVLLDDNRAVELPAVLDGSVRREESDDGEVDARTQEQWFHVARDLTVSLYDGHRFRGDGAHLTLALIEEADEEASFGSLLDGIANGEFEVSRPGL
jgi:hypothetical protein